MISEKQAAPKVSLVMPAFNEEEVIEEVVTEYTETLSSLNCFEIVVVDDCSKDSTLAILQSVSERNPRLRVIALEKNRGHGPALAIAFRAAEGESVFHCDSDGQFFPSDFFLLWQNMEQQKLDVAVGFRKDRQDPFARLVLTKLLRFFLLIFFGENQRDSNSPFRIYRRSALNEILPLLPEYPLVPSILMLVAASKLNFKVGWIPVRHRARSTGISFLRSWKIFKLCFPALKEVVSFKRTIGKIERSKSA